MIINRIVILSEGFFIHIYGKKKIFPYIRNKIAEEPIGQEGGLKHYH